MTGKPQIIGKPQIMGEAHVDNPNVGPEPVDVQPNHLREKTYQAPDVPEVYEREIGRLPEKTAGDAVERDMDGAVDAVKAKL